MQRLLEEDTVEKEDAKINRGRQIVRTEDATINRKTDRIRTEDAEINRGRHSKERRRRY